MVTNEHKPHVRLQVALQMCGSDLIQCSGQILERSVLRPDETAVPTYRVEGLRKIAAELNASIDAYEAAKNAAEAEVVIVTPSAANVHPALGGVQ